MAHAKPQVTIDLAEYQELQKAINTPDEWKTATQKVLFALITTRMNLSSVSLSPSATMLTHELLMKFKELGVVFQWDNSKRQLAPSDIMVELRTKS